MHGQEWSFKPLWFTCGSLNEGVCCTLSDERLQDIVVWNMEDMSWMLGFLPCKGITCPTDIMTSDS